MNNMQAQQFAALQKATKVYLDEAKTADHMRRREGDLMNREVQQQNRLEEELRVAHGELGEETRKRRNLEVERNRHSQSSEADRQANVTITSELKGVEADEKEQKQQFVKEMDSVCYESDFLLTKCENKKATRFLGSDEVNWLMESKVAVFATGNSGVADDGNTNWNEVYTNAKDELVGLVKIEQKSGEANETNQLEQYLQQLRAKFTAEHANIGEMEIADLEAKWEQNYQYNGQEEGQGEHGAADGVAGGKTLNHSAGVDESSPIHMQMFYDAQEYEGPIYDANSANGIGQAC